MKLKRAVIKEETLAITNDYKTAIILNQLMYWTERVGRKKYEKFEKEEENRKVGDTENLQGGWVYKTSEELSEETMLNVSPSTIRRYIKDLIEKGYILERDNPNVKFDHTKQYRINLLKIANDMLKKGYILQDYKFSWLTDSIFQNENRELQNENSNFQNENTIPEITTEITTENTKSSNSCSDKSPNEKSDDEPKFDEDSEPYKAAVYLRRKVNSNFPKQPTPNENPKDLEDWAVELDRLNRLGTVGAEDKGYSWEEIYEIMMWCQDDIFWKKNILSAGKFRKQIVRLEADMKEDKSKNNNSKPSTDKKERPKISDREIRRF